MGKRYRPPPKGRRWELWFHFLRLLLGKKIQPPKHGVGKRPSDLTAIRGSGNLSVAKLKREGLPELRFGGLFLPMVLLSYAAALARLDMSNRNKLV